MSDVAKQQAGLSPMNDQSNVAAHPNRPESPILRPLEFVELQAGMRRVQLEIECRCLHGLLLTAGKLGQAIGKRVRNTEFHQSIKVFRLLLQHSDIPERNTRTINILVN